MTDREQTGADARVRLVIDADRCQGHNRCAAHIPDLISFDDHGFAQVLATGTVPRGLVDQARLAVRNCPEQAIRLESVTGKEGTS